MNIERLMSMFIRLFMRKVMSRSIDAGIDYTTGRRGKAEASPEDRARARSAKQMAKKARQGAKIARRIGRL